jgi:pimeloyl-ACP methyl ester carboxylesterase
MDMTSAQSPGRIEILNGVQLYYEVHGNGEPLLLLHGSVEISVEMARAIPRSSLWILPDAGHGPVIGGRWTEFLKTAAAFLQTVEPNS